MRTFLKGTCHRSKQQHFMGRWKRRRFSSIVMIHLFNTGMNLYVAGQTLTAKHRTPTTDKRYLYIVLDKCNKNHNVTGL